MTKRELIIALIDDDSEMDSEICIDGNIFESEEIETSELSICFVNNNEDEEPILIVG